MVATFKLSRAANSSSIRPRSPAAARRKMFFAISARLKVVRMVAGSDATVRSNMSPKRESSSGSKALLCSHNIGAAPLQIIALSLLPRDLFALGQKQDRSAARARRRRSVFRMPRSGAPIGHRCAEKLSVLCSIGRSHAPASRSLIFPDELPTLALEQADGFSVPRIQQSFDEVWSSTAIGAPAIFLRAFRSRSFAIIVHGSPSANAAQYAGCRQVIK